MARLRTTDIKIYNIGLKSKHLLFKANQIELILKWPSSSQYVKLFEDIIYVHTLGVAVPTHQCWSLGDEGKQAKSHRGVQVRPLTL